MLTPRELKMQTLFALHRLLSFLLKPLKFKMHTCKGEIVQHDAKPTSLQSGLRPHVVLGANQFYGMPFHTAVMLSRIHHNLSLTTKGYAEKQSRRSKAYLIPQPQANHNRA